MFLKVFMDLKYISVLLLVLMISGSSPLKVQETKVPSEKKPTLSPEMKKTLDKAFTPLVEWIRAHNKKIKEIEGRLFSSPQKILDLCQSPLRPKRYRSVLSHLKLTNGDPVSFPTVDCLFVKDNMGGGLLWSYKPTKDKSYYILRKHDGANPRGAYAFARHPLQFINRLKFKTDDWALTRSIFPSLKSFPLKADSFLELTEYRAGKGPVKLKVEVVKSFPMIHQVNGLPTQVETLHIVVQHLPPKIIFGKLENLRRWYIYSEKANVILQRSHSLILQDSINKAGTGVSKNLSSISYIKDGRYSLNLSEEDLEPLRVYLKDFDVWALQ